MENGRSAKSGLLTSKLVQLCVIASGPKFLAITGHEPKKIIGDIVNLFLADQARVKGKDYTLGDLELELVLGLQVSARGKARDKAMTICEKLYKMSARLGKRKFTILPVFGQDLEKLVSQVHDKIELKLKRLDELAKRQVLEPG